MANNSNLTPFVKGSDKARECGRKGGRASKAANLQRRSLREWCEELLHTAAPGKGTPMTNGQKMVLSMMKAAQKGNPKAFVAVAEVLGERKGALAIGLELPTLVDDVPRAPDPVKDAPGD